MSQAIFDAIVLGTGGIGSAALFQLARRGQRVLGIDQFTAGHDRGSSHGETRVIRKAYFEHPNYVPLLQRAYENWAELERLSGHQVFFRTGILEIGPPDGILVPGVRAAAERYRLPLEELAPADVARRYPDFHLPKGQVALFEADGGYLLVEQCVQHYLRLAVDHGAQQLFDTAVTSWESDGAVARVTTDGATYQARRLLLTPGAWAPQLLAAAGIRLHVLRKHLHWYAIAPGAYAVAAGSPVFFYETAAGCYYGFPSLDGHSLKVAEHSGGQRIVDPLRIDRSVDPQERGRVEQFLRRHLPQVQLEARRHSVCMYTMTADEHFIVDQHPQHPNVLIAAGLSGHGFKFASVLGEILADLATGQTPPLSIDFLRIQRLLAPPA